MFVVVAFVILVLSVALCLGQFLGPDRLRDVARRLGHPQFTIRQMMAAVAVIALLLIAVGSGSDHESAVAMTLLGIGVLAWFARTWQGEFVFLMGLRDEDFPGRHDKMIWVVTILALAPVGVWFFRAYRRAHWPEPVPTIDGEGHAEESGDAAAQPA